MYREWSTVWQGQPIAVKVWYYNILFFRLKEELWIGDLLVERNKMRSWFLNGYTLERLAIPFSIDDSFSERQRQRVHHLEASFYYSDKPYCNISVDGEIIGGDIDLKIPQIDLTVWPDIRRRGFLHFIVKYMRVDVLKIIYTEAMYLVFLFPLGYICFYFTLPSPIVWESTVSVSIKLTYFAMIISLLGGLAISFNRWRIWGQLYADNLTHQQKLKAPAIRLESGGVLKDVS